MHAQYFLRFRYFQRLIIETQTRNVDGTLHEVDRHGIALGGIEFHVIVFTPIF